MKRLMLLVGLLLALLGPVYGENPIKDWLKEAEKAPNKQKAILLNKVARHVLLADPDKAMEYAEEALTRIGRTNDRLTESLIRVTVADIHAQKKEWDQAASALQKSLDLARKAKADPEQIDRLLRLGKLHQSIGQITKVLPYYTDALKIATDNGLRTSSGQIYWLIGEFNYYRRYYDKALQYYQTAIHAAMEAGNDDLVILCWNRTGDSRLARDENQEAMEAYSKALQLLDSAKTPLETQFITYRNMSAIHETLQHLDTSIEFSNKAIEIQDQIQRDKALDLYNAHTALGNGSRAREAYEEYNRANLRIIEERESRKSREWEDKARSSEVETFKMRRAQARRDSMLRVMRLETSVLKGEKQVKEGMIDSLTKVSIKKEEYINYLHQEQKLNRIELSKRELELSLSRMRIEKQELALQRKQVINLALSLFAGIVVLTAFFMINRARIKRKAHINLTRAHEELKKAHEEITRQKLEMENLARKDPLTSLSNRREVLERIHHEISRFERSKVNFTLIIGDLDFFKKVNDSHGHDAGDFVLVEIGKLMQETVRRQDIVSRWGGEEFLIMLPETDTDGGITLAEKIREIIQDHVFVYKDFEIRVTMTFGLRMFDGTGDIEDCIQKADEALYHGKKNGRNRVIPA